LVGKIAFLSDRAGRGEETGLEPLVYVMDPDGRQVTLMSDRAAYDTALARDSYSADQRFRAFVKDVPSYVDSGRKNKKGRSIVEYVPQPAIIWRDDLYNAEEQVTYFGSGIAYDPVWSPTREQIALVSTDSGNDEIWVVNRDGSGLLQLTRDVNYDKRPSWSPDGSQIVFWSNRTGNAQVWVMKADGSDQRIINPNPFNDWNPVWIKYTDLPPLLPEPTPTSRPIFDRFN
jgi:Tol biopolymer transport system component